MKCKLDENCGTISKHFVRRKYNAYNYRYMIIFINDYFGIYLVFSMILNKVFPMIQNGSINGRRRIIEMKDVRRQAKQIFSC